VVMAPKPKTPIPNPQSPNHISAIKCFIFDYNVY
jgi:hypothetical protein